MIVRPSSSQCLPQTKGSLRVLLYSHDSWGLGHLRRNLTIAEAIVREVPSATVLIATGSACASFFQTPDRVDTLKLPSVTKDAEGTYQPRSLAGSLEATLELRRAILSAAFDSFRPHALIVDHQVTGLGGEVLPLLRRAKDEGVRTLLGIRDVIDDPKVVEREWGTDDRRWALAEGYDRVCVYGVPEVFDTRLEYPLPPELSERVEFTGYVTRTTRPASRRPIPRTEPHVLVTMGGGEDGADRIRQYVEAISGEPVAWSSTIVGGPMLGRAAARELKRASRLAGVTFHRSHTDLPRLYEEANVVVGMAGYNTCTEVLRHRRAAVYLPRTSPRREQAIRADRLAQLGWAESFEDPSAGDLRGAVERALSASLPAMTPALDGARRVCEVLLEVLADSLVPRRQSDERAGLGARS